MLAPVPTPKASVAEVVVAATQPQPQRQPTAQLASDPSGATTEPTDQPKAANPTVLWPRFR
jgi:hypothetical protein